MSIHDEIGVFMSVYLPRLSTSTKRQRSVPDIPIKERYEPEVMSFTKDEFIDYLADHAETLKEITTYKLNKMFDIEGYRVTKIRGEVGLIASPSAPKNDPIQQRLDVIEGLLRQLITSLTAPVDRADDDTSTTHDYPRINPRSGNNPLH